MSDEFNAEQEGLFLLCQAIDGVMRQMGPDGTMAMQALLTIAQQRCLLYAVEKLRRAADTGDRREFAQHVRIKAIDLTHELNERLSRPLGSQSSTEMLADVCEKVGWAKRITDECLPESIIPNELRKGASDEK